MQTKSYLLLLSLWPYHPQPSIRLFNPLLHIKLTSDFQVNLQACLYVTQYQHFMQLVTSLCICLPGIGLSWIFPPLLLLLPVYSFGSFSSWNVHVTRNFCLFFWGGTPISVQGSPLALCWNTVSPIKAGFVFTVPGIEAINTSQEVTYHWARSQARVLSFVWCSHLWWEQCLADSVFSINLCWKDETDKKCPSGTAKAHLTYEGGTHMQLEKARHSKQKPSTEPNKLLTLRKEPIWTKEWRGGWQCCLQWCAEAAVHAHSLS